MKHVENDDGKHKQDLFHGGEKVSSRFGECQERYSHKEAQRGIWQSSSFSLFRTKQQPKGYTLTYAKFLFVPFCG